MKSTLKGYLFVIISAIVYGCMPLGAKIIYADGVNAMSLVLYRNLLAIPIMALLVKLQGDTLAVTRQELGKVTLLSMLGACITPLMLFLSYNFISSGTATTFHFIYPAAVVLGGIVFLREKVRIPALLCVILCTVGACLFYTPEQHIDPFGSALALLSGVVYAAYIILLSRSGLQKMSGFKLSMYMSAVCSVVMLAVCLALGALTFPGSLRGWLACLIFSLTLCIGAVYLFQQGAFLIGSQRAAILSTFEPITSLIIGVLVFREALTARSVLGAILIVAATVGISLSDLLAARPHKSKIPTK